MEIKRNRNLKQLICAPVSCIQSCISLSCEDLCHTLSIIYKKNCAGTQICGPQTCVLCFFYFYNRFASERHFNVKWRFLRLTLFFFFKKVWLFQIKAVSLHHQNPPSLSTMLKCAGRFIFIQWVTESHSRSLTPVRTILSVSCSQEVWQLQILPRLRVISNILAITACQPICILCYRCRRSNIAINRAQRLVKWWCSIVSTRNFDCLSSMR